MTYKGNSDNITLKSDFFFLSNLEDLLQSKEKQNCIY